jgi:RNA polymerase sigma-70 factor, ECF subfamily
MVDEVVRRCQEGDRSAFQELFRLHGGMIQKISIRMTRNQEWQRDIFQEVVRQVIDNIKSFRGECKFTTWLYRITVNAAVLFLKREGTYKNMTPIEDEILDRGNGGDGALGWVAKKEMFGHAMEAIMTLPHENRNIVSLFYFAERSIEEISELTGKSGGAIKAVLWKSRRAIIKKLKQQGLMKVV